MVHVGLNTLDDFVEAFERDCQSGRAGGLKDYLPNRGDTLYLPVLRELVRIDLEHGWEWKRPRALEDYRADFPELFEDAQSLQEVAFEEYRLRRQAGQSPSPEEYSRRYGVRTDGWPRPAAPPEELEASARVETAAQTFRAFLLGQRSAADPASVPIDDWRPPAEAGPVVARLFRDLHAADGRLAGRVVDGLSSMPTVGEEFASFHLVAELGRGAFGRVFLARQAALAGRPVALKVAPDVGGESQTLARLQHTHIVPVYSVHRQGALQAVCMPYCGAVTVADLTRRLRALPRLPTEGLALLAALAGRERPSGVDTLPGPAPAVREALAKLDYPTAVLWLGGRVAEGLAHAHERGVQHRDVKPANLLLTDEGVPMLLDFNVAEDVMSGGPAAAMLGGTMPYMAPEHLAAFQHDGPGVDARADVYSLGLVLYELLTGRFPFPPIRLAEETPEAMERMILSLRQARAGPPPCPRTHNPTVSPATAAIVRRCLEPDPARRYPSAKALAEDIDRQLRHEPLLHAGETSLLERGRKWARRHPRLGPRLSAAAVLLLAAVAAVSAWRAAGLRQAGQAREALARFAPLFRQAQFLLLVPSATKPEREQGQAAAREALGLFDVLTDDDWPNRPRITTLPSGERERTLAEQGELLLLLAGHGSDRAEAERYNRRAELCYHPDDAPALLWEQRGDDERARAAPADSVRNRYLKAAGLILRRRYAEARRLLLPAAQDEPDNYAVQLLLGIAHEGTGNEAAACRCYTACVALAPGFYGPYLARADSYNRQRNYREAEADLDRAIALNPQRPQSYFERARVRRWLRGKDGKPRYEEAVADLTTARDKGLPDTRVYFFRAQLRRLLGDHDGSRADFEAGLKLTPSDPVSWDARGYAQMNTAPEKALADFDQALKLDPANQNALMNKASTLAEVLGRQDEARTVLERALSLYPEYIPALAGQAVVLARLKKREPALDLIEKALQGAPDGLTKYQAACVYALTSRVEPDDAATALYHLREALELRFGLQHLDSDKDLDPIRSHPGFARLSRLAALLRERQAPPRVQPHQD